MNAPPRSRPSLGRDAFRALAATRPDDEHWELIGGVAMTMTPPSKVHQRIASNLERLLNDALELRDPSRAAYQRIGVTLAEAPDYDPEPDVVVIDRDEPDERYAHAVHLVAEIVSASDGAKVEAKRSVYRLHPACRIILTVEQTQAEIRIDARTGEGWMVATLTGLATALVLPEFGLTTTLAEIYRRTGIG